MSEWQPIATAPKDVMSPDPVLKALATEVLAQRDRRCGTCRHWADEDGNDICQHLRLANLPAHFGCTDWAAKEGA